MWRRFSTHLLACVHVQVSCLIEHSAPTGALRSRHLEQTAASSVQKCAATSASICFFLYCDSRCLLIVLRFSAPRRSKVLSIEPVIKVFTLPGSPTSIRKPFGQVRGQRRHFDEWISTSSLYFNYCRCCAAVVRLGAAGCWTNEAP